MKHEASIKHEASQQMKHVVRSSLAKGVLEGAVDFIRIFFFALLFFISSSCFFYGEEVNTFDFSTLRVLFRFGADGRGDSSSINDRDLPSTSFVSTVGDKTST